MSRIVKIYGVRTTSDQSSVSAPARTDEWQPSLAEADGVASDMGTDTKRGLTAAEAASRLERYGPNELTGKPPVPAWKKFIKQFQDPLIYLLIVAILISIVAWVADGATGVPVDAIVIGVIVVLNAIIGFVQENKAENAVAALADMTAAHSTVLRDGELTDVASADIVPGDVLVLNEGDAVGADARLISATSLQVLESSLTGESEAVTKQTEALEEEASLGDRTNMVFKGTAVVTGVGRAVVTGTAMDTEMGKIASMLDETEDEDSPLQQEIAQISKMLGGLVIVIALIVMAALAIINGVSSLNEAVDILLMGVSLAVAAVPEGLPAILSLVLAIGVQQLAKRNAVMKSLHSVETLGSTSVICSDKTGTLTKNEMTLREMVTPSGTTTFEGTGYEPVGDVSATDGGALDEARRAVAAGALANNAQLSNSSGSWKITGDPTEAAFLVGAPKLDGTTAVVDRFDRLGEVPFSSERKMMSVLARGEGATFVFSKGAPDVLVSLCDYVQVGDETIEITDEHRQAVLETVESLSKDGYRTLGTAYRKASDDEAADFTSESEHSLVYLGTAGIIDPPRPEAADAMRHAHGAGIRTVMITGDHPVTAARIAADLNVSGDRTPTAVTGTEIDAMDEAARRATTRDTDVYARVAPEHKLQIVDALQDDGHIVAMTGDGVNDAPALKSADIGVAMGVTGTEVTKETGDMILGDDNYATIVAAVRQGRVVFDNIKKFMRYLLSSNMGEVSTVFLGVVLASVIGLADPVNPGATVVPLLATQILWINLVTDSGPALAMGVDPEIDDVMTRTPRKRTDRIIDGAMWSRIITIGLVMGVLSLVIYDLTLPGGLVNGFEGLVPAEAQLDTARTTVFTALVFMQLFNAFNSRSELHSAFDHLFTNKWLWASVAFVVITQVLVVEWGPLQTAFGAVSLHWQHWALAIGAGAAVLMFEEIVKVIRRARA